MTGLVLEGGGLRGMFTAGILDVLMENDVCFDGVIGVSAGATFGCNYVSRQPGRVLRYQLRYIHDDRYMSLASLRRTGDLVGASFAYHYLPTHLDLFDFDAFRHNPTQFHLVCTDAQRGTPVYRRLTTMDDEELDWLRASASMPLVSRPVELDGLQLLDGGITDSIPLRYFQSIGFDRNVVVLTQPLGFRKRRTALMPFFHLFMRRHPAIVQAMARRHEMYNAQLDYLAQQVALGNTLLIAPDEAIPIGRTERNPRKIQQVYDMGRRAGEKYLERVKKFLTTTPSPTLPLGGCRGGGRIFALGETVLDMIFQDEQPVAAVHGGSSFNSIISLGRTGTPCAFIGYAGDDHVGRRTQTFLRDNGVDNTYFQLRPGEKSALSLAFLDANGDANYSFYKNPPTHDPSAPLPQMQQGDILLFGSYYAICQGTRPQVSDMLLRAHEAQSIVYYDVNFRRPHLAEKPQLMPAIESNFSLSTIVRGSADDFEILFSSRDAEYIYTHHVSPFCPLFICTSGEGEVAVCTPTGIHRFPSPTITDVVSTVGAGDNFNAGLCYALLHKALRPADLLDLTASQWADLLHYAFLFAGEACRTTENYIQTLPD